MALIATGLTCVLPGGSPDERQRAKLRQQPWTPAMIWSGHLGNHASILMYWWNKAYVAPHLLDARCAAGAPAAARTTTAE
jgi:hypothetical protein